MQDIVIMSEEQYSDYAEKEIERLREKINTLPQVADAMTLKLADLAQTIHDEMRARGYNIKSCEMVRALIADKLNALHETKAAE